jgi:serine/threonine protein phosphatase 1
MTSHTGLTFEASVSPRRIDADVYQTIYVVGDVHGCRETFERLLNEIDLQENELVVLVGDLVRKGPDSTGVLDIVRVHENIYSVRGNNEAKLLSGEKTLPELDEDDLAWLAELPHAISWDDTLVVHGGVLPETPLAAQTPDTLLETRAPHGDGYDGPFWFDAYEGPPRVFFGHTVLEAPFEREWAVGLDTGCVYGGQLTAYDTSAGEFISVEPAETHQERSQDDIVDEQLVSGC